MVIDLPAEHGISPLMICRRSACELPRHAYAAEGDRLVLPLPSLRSAFESNRGSGVNGKPPALKQLSNHVAVRLLELPSARKKSEARRAFRLKLLDLGFEMSNIPSICVLRRKGAGRELRTQDRASDADAGKVHIVAITDKQYETSGPIVGENVNTAAKIPNNSPCFDLTGNFPAHNKKKGPVPGP